MAGMVSGLEDQCKAESVGKFFFGTTDVVNPDPFRRDFILVTLTKFKTDRMKGKVV